MTVLREGAIWRNWGENQTCAPALYAEPRTEAELVAAVREGIAAGLSIRVAGTGHSSSPLVQTGGLLLSLQHLSGVIETDVARRRARMWAGTPISALGDPLWEPAWRSRTRATSTSRPSPAPSPPAPTARAPGCRASPGRSARSG